jgi:hypothetical protein
MGDNGKALNLRIEGGILLKPYVAPLTRDKGGSHRAPAGWTPDHTPAMQARFDELRGATAAPDFILWLQVEQEEGQRLVKLRRPYPGWFPVRPKTDSDIVRAYRALFLRMNPGAEKRVRVSGVWSGPQTKTPPDGDYQLVGGVMSLVRASDTAVRDEVERLVWEAFHGATGKGDK